jgi:hypothetical protein
MLIDPFKQRGREDTKKPWARNLPQSVTLENFTTTSKVCVIPNVFDTKFNPFNKLNL